MTAIKTSDKLKRFEIAAQKPERRIVRWAHNATEARKFAESKGLDVVRVHLRPIEKDIARF